MPCIIQIQANPAIHYFVHRLRADLFLKRARCAGKQTGNHNIISAVKYGGKSAKCIKVRKSPGRATITNRSPSQTPRGRGNGQIQTSTNRTNVRKALRLALSSIAILKGLKNTRTKCHTEIHTTNRLVE